MPHLLRASAPHLMPLAVALVLLVQQSGPGTASARDARATAAVSERQCLNCHAAEPAVESRVRRREAPSLAGVGARVSPGYVVDLLAKAPSDRPGTTMPDLLTEVTEGASRDAVARALASYLATLGGPFDAGGRTPIEEGQLERGKRLYGQVGCVACHGPAEGATAARGVDFSPLPDLAAKTTRAELAHFLRDPLAQRPSGRMPSLGLTEREASDIAAYLLRSQRDVDAAGKPVLHESPGLIAEYYEGEWTKLPDFTKLAPLARTPVDKVELPKPRRDDHFAWRYSGKLRIRTPGEYQFFIASDDGSSLRLDGALVADNDGEHPTAEKSGKIQLTAGDHALELRYLEIAGEESLKLSWKGPGIEKTEVPPDAFTHAGESLVARADKAPDAPAAEGRRWFERLQCFRCHGDPEGAAPQAPAAKPWGALRESRDLGCLDTNPKSNIPRFAFGADERELLLAAMRADARPQPAAGELVLERLAVYRCLACHARDGAGGPSAERQGWFSTLGEAELGDEGRLPPPLTGVGRKLRPEWITAVLEGRGAVRPYMATRMPQFGAANVGDLRSMLETADGAQPDADVNFSDEMVKAGQDLAGTGALTCISCHKLAGHDSLGVPAVDLATTYKRLRVRWFREYLADPGALRPGTRMPRFFNGETSSLARVLGGSTEKQLDALWCYFSLGESMPLPRGLKLADDLELVPRDGPVVFRTFINDVGPRAIGLGFPEGGHAAFDADACSLSLAWTGRFLSAESAWVGRAGRFTSPLGAHARSLGRGPECFYWKKEASPAGGAADLLSQTAPAHAAFRGYEIVKPDAVRVYYDVTTEAGAAPIHVTEEVSATRSLGKCGLKRRITARGDGTDRALAFRAATAGRVEQESPNTYILDGQWRISLSAVLPPAAAIAPGADGATNLMIVLPIAAGASAAQAGIEMEIWP